ncbi:taste receptor type 2 member 8-like [Hyla sarda]|uniref:taste receptor type 2 member 8-like n=1 Tax=Hyla sarda TaxID=327740 RepID=UPI0024C25201|nr:taste receptor type 2 member 8-like [Hyla sarda]
MMSAGPLTVLYVLFLSFEVCVSIFINMFITFVIVHDYYLKKSLTSLQKILVALNASSIFFIIVSSFNVFSNLLLPEFSETLSYSMTMTVFFIYSMCSSTYLTAILCFYYFIKVVNVQRGFLVWIKKEIGSLVHWQIVVAKLFSLVNSLLSLLLFTSHHLPVTNGSFIPLNSATLEKSSVDDNILKFLLIMISLPLLCTAITILLTVGFLKFHSDKMEKAQTSGEAGLTLYKRVIYKMLRFLVLYSVFYLVMFLYYFNVFAAYSPGYYINLMLMFLFTPTQSALHILDNQYLRSPWREMVGRILRSTHRNV